MASSFSACTPRASEVALESEARPASAVGAPAETETARGAGVGELLNPSAPVADHATEDPADAINGSGPYESPRNRILGLDYQTQLPKMKAIAGQADYALSSVHGVTRDGALVIASASGSQLASYVWGAANVIFVVGTQKLVPSPEAAREGIYEHGLKLEDARAYAAYVQNSVVGKILEIHQETPGRIHVVRIRQSVGF
jgi:hypothetical protein